MRWLDETSAEQPELRAACDGLKYLAEELAAKGDGFVSRAVAGDREDPGGTSTIYASLK